MLHFCPKGRRGFLRAAASLGFVTWLGERRVWADSVPRSSGPRNGALLAIGGGRRGREIQNTAIRLSGRQPHWVYIPTAASDAELGSQRPPDLIRRSGASVTVLHSRDRAVADSEAFVAPLLAATAVFFEGGRQWRLVDAYGGTRTEAALRGVLDRGGLIAGTSAGATIQGSYLVRGSPASNAILMSPGHERGFSYLSNVAIDQHVSQRGRADDLAQVVAAHPGLLGIGIDEGTAIVVQHDIMTIIGDSVVRITDGADHDGLPYYALPHGARFDLAAWRRL